MAGEEGENRMKLSKPQQNIIDKMANGWELGWSHSFLVRCWLQKGGIGAGGQSEDVSDRSVSALFKQGLIKQAGRKNGAMIFELRQVLT